MADSLFPLFLDGTILDYRLKLTSLSENIETVQIFNKNFEEYSVTTPFFYVIEDDFYLKLGNEIYFVLVKIDYFIDKPSLKNEQNNVVLKEITKKLLPGDFLEKEVTLTFHDFLAKNLQKAESKFLNADYFKNLVFEAINQVSLKKKKELDFLEFKINFLGRKLENLLQAKQEIDVILEKKGRKRVNIITSLILTQICLIQYGTYCVFSWDIMEPITCLLGVMDLIIPYYFWLRHEKDYSFETIKEVSIEKKANRAYKTRNVNFINEEIETVKEMLNALKKRRIFYTDDEKLILSEMR